MQAVEKWAGNTSNLDLCLFLWVLAPTGMSWQHWSDKWNSPSFLCATAGSAGDKGPSDSWHLPAGHSWWNTATPQQACEPCSWLHHFPFSPLPAFIGIDFCLKKSLSQQTLAVYQAVFLWKQCYSSALRPWQAKNRLGASHGQLDLNPSAHRLLFTHFSKITPNC